MHIMKRRVGFSICHLQHAMRRSRNISNPSRLVSTRSRTYEDALELLKSTSSNLSIVSKFETTENTADLNALAKPEMMKSLSQAGYTIQDLCSMRHIHVAGSKGKGSVCAFATSILLQHKPLLSGTGVGTYTSPHLISLRERIAIDGKPVHTDIFAEAVFELWDRFTETAKAEQTLTDEEAEGPMSKPFFFRFMTILAWHIFLKLGIKDVVMECGIGGEYDATNILPPAAVSTSVITQLDKDHVKLLGSSLEEIAWHKGGVIKAGKHCFTRNLTYNPKAMTVLRQRASEARGSKLVEVDNVLVKDWGGIDGNLKGSFQKYNQALALLAVRQHLGKDADPVRALHTVTKEEEVGLRKARLRGRCEVVKQVDVTWYLDGAHTPISIEQVASWFSNETLPDEKSILIFNQQERDASDLLTHLLTSMNRPGAFSHAIFTRNELYKVEDSPELDLDVQEKAAGRMEALEPECVVAVCDNVQDTINQARMVARATGSKVLVTGSLHLVGAVLKHSSLGVTARRR